MWSSQAVDEALTSNEYDAAIISVYHHLPSPGVASSVGHKTAMCWWDSIVSMGGVRGWAGSIHQLCFDWGKGEEFPNCFSVEVPQDTRHFRPDDSVAKDIDVSFVGSIGAPWSDRGALIQKLRDGGINVWSGGGRGPGFDNLSIEEYSNVFRRSKICLNLSYGHGQPQRKGRSFEIAASKGFMMTNCPQMFHGKDGNWFEEGLEYISFDDSNVVEKVKYYLDHEQERNDIAHRLYETYRNNYAPKYFWGKVLGICGATVKENA